LLIGHDQDAPTGSLANLAYHQAHLYHVSLNKCSLNDVCIVLSFSLLAVTCVKS
jgi:hypothetical protein